MALGLEDSQVNLSVSLGGSGGTAGNGGAVEVDNSGIIETFGETSHGIFAQSVGGGGGSGGFNASGSLGKGTQAKDLSVSIGGFGGAGGDADRVDVANEGAIVTRGNDSCGIQAQSLGGGGGDGGFSFAGSFGGAEAKNLSVGIGGFGGLGGDGKEIHVTNRGAIDTSGEDSHGIFAQSVGGGGGDGGSRLSLGLGFGGSRDTWNINSTVTIGGSGGSGDVGGAVWVSNTADIITRNSDSHGIFAQSIGGGGGSGGSSLTATIELGAANEGRSLNGSISVGGSGGVGNEGGYVAVENAGGIFTLGDMSDGIRAQSIGGGGGNGGDARGVSLLLNAGSTTLENNQASGSNWKSAVNVGGTGGSSNDGGIVTVSNSGSITTQGAYSRAIFAQSIGGGGGSGGEGINGTSTEADYVTLASFPATTMGGSGSSAARTLLGQLMDVSYTVGGNAGSSGNGNDVSIGNTGDIVTTGYGSTAIFAQSIGGGGGEALGFSTAGDNGGKAVGGLLGRFSIGGSGGATGDGGNISINHSGSVKTYGDSAHGIFAQSVGGGGGVAGDVDRDIVAGIGSTKNTGIDLALGRDGGGSGDGGTVTVSSSGDIHTYGDDSYGIYAQSVGGGGGKAGGLGLGSQNLLSFIDFSGSVGGDGSGKAVSITHSGNIVTRGEGSDCIFAQSAGGTGAGAVNVTIDGNIIAQGKDANGIFAQSIGNAGQSTDSPAQGKDADGVFAQGICNTGQNGNITINILGGTVQGGTGEGAGVVFADGNDNSLINRGLVTTASGIYGDAVIGTTGSETIYNFGTVVGGVDLGTGSNAFNNESGGVFISGGRVSLGSGNLLTNSGVFSPGGASSLMTTEITGNVLQTQSGTLFVDLDLSSLQADLIRVSGKSDLAGTTVVNLLNTGYAKPGSGQVTLFTSAGGLTNWGVGLVAWESAVLDYTLLFPNSTDMTLAFDIDFAPPGLNENEKAVGRYFNAVQLAGGSVGFAPVIAELFALPDLPSLARAYDMLLPEVYDAATLATLDVTRQYLSTLQHRMQSLRSTLGLAMIGRVDESGSTPQTGKKGEPEHDEAGDNTKPEFRKRQRCGAWLEGLSRFGDVSGVNGFRDFALVMGGGTLGVDCAFRDWFVAGADFGYASTEVDLGSNWASGNVRSIYGSVYGTAFSERAYVEGVLSYGRHRFKVDRAMKIGSIERQANSRHYGNAFAALLEGGYSFPVHNWTFQPFASLCYNFLDEGSVKESGAGALDMGLKSRQTSALASEIGVRVKRPVASPKGLLVPEVGVAWKYDFEIDTRRLPTSFSGRPDIGFSINGRELGRNRATVDSGVTFVGKKGISTTIRYNGEFGDKVNAHGVSGQIRFSF